MSSTRTPHNPWRDEVDRLRDELISARKLAANELQESEALRARVAELEAHIEENTAPIGWYEGACEKIKERGERMKKMWGVLSYLSDPVTRDFRHWFDESGEPK